MIVLKKIRYKNFLSTGNNFTEIDLQKTKTTLIVGSNGAGKSTMVDAISYALFGKPHRNIKLAQLINSVNEKDMCVEVEFDIGDSQYRVVRGLKPNKFEIWKDDVLINQESHNRQYQKMLEQNILRHNHKSFHQVEVLSSSNFVAFMQLKSWQRREVIEDLLDINIFSRMKVVLKQRSNELRDHIRENDHEIELVETKIDSQERHITELKKISASYTSEKNSEIEKLQKSIEETQNNLASQPKSMVTMLRQELSQKHKTSDSISSYKKQFKSKITQLGKEISFFEDNAVCPTCDQEINDDLRKHKQESASDKIKELEGGVAKADEELTTLSKRTSVLQTQIDDEIIRLAQVDALQNQITEYQQRITELQKELQKKETTDNVASAEETLSNLLSQKDNLLKTKYVYGEQREYLAVITELLKDTGIKTKIIKQYLPAMNKFLNGYLQVLDFYVHFELNEEFKETILSRHRDNFSYDSFSEGEKQRIDLALLFTWRQIAKMKNSMSTNLLVLDETFDSSLDQEGVENLFKILDTIDSNTNIFVISHKPEVMQDKFDRGLVFAKKNNFSTYSEQL